MDSDLPLFPTQASTMAPEVDALFFFISAVVVAFAALVFALVIVFAVRYRRRTPSASGALVQPNYWLEAAWIGVPLVLCLVIFAWGARLYFRQARPPSDVLDVYVLGRQWMWKLQHAEGPSEINELHVPLGRPIRLTMTSQDVIHSFFVPAFRLKMDVVPGRYVNAWFQATRTGEYHLFCAEYCGTKHSGMIGRVIVLQPADYERWLAGGTSGPGLAAAGERLFQSLGCATCHAEGQSRGPTLANLFGRTITLRDRSTVVADEAYVRESILDPNVKLVAGFEPVMPAYRAQVNEEDLIKLVAYLKTLTAGPETRSVK
ncbi:MAG TPA: cytochrome c oxidase subunit II [Planctomycetota bacterium]|nr:cytochrome c oxidase subunit II [Planctomycetota bacterium]